MFMSKQFKLRLKEKEKALLYSPMVVCFDWANLNVLDMRHKHFFCGNGASASSYIQRIASAKSRVASPNVITATVKSIPDTYKVLSGKISGKEYGIRMAERGAGIGGGTAGTWAGMAIGSFICPGVGTAIGGFVGGMLGSIGSSKAASKCLR